MGHLIFVSHPQVVVDPEVPVTQWSLSHEGKQALQSFLQKNIWPVPEMVWCSDETKAQQTAESLAQYFACPFETHAALGENDRSATGFLPVAEFEQVADCFFAQPEESIRGWEKAIDAQARICEAVAALLLKASRSGYKKTAIAGHGATGTLLYCALAGLQISRQYDQPSQGHYWCYDLDKQQMLHGWRSIHE